MSRFTLFALATITIGLGGCIKSSATADDPERDAAVEAAVDAQIADARTDAVQMPRPPPEPGPPEPMPPEPDPEQSCDAEPVCPPGYDAVQVCAPGAICETVTECGDGILCQICPPGVGFMCENGTYEVERCTNDATCFEISDCGGSIACESCEVCPEGMIRVLDCPPDTDCFRCDGDNDGLFPLCAPEEAVRCPPHTTRTQGCLEGDPLCWVLDDGTACVSTICPVGNPCGGQEANPVDACAPDALGCFERTICGDSLVCEVISHDCDGCEPFCPNGSSPVPRCAPDGRACLYIAECCSELFCQADQ